MFTIKEIFSTIQGEGSKVGTPAIFVRFAGCNLWSGQEHLREQGKGECSLWCDTKFFRGDKYETSELLIRLNKMSDGWKNKMVVFTGGEPTLQLKKPDAIALVERLLNTDWIVSVETNGTISLEECPVLNIIHKHKNGHITVSPKLLKSNMINMDHLKLRSGTDLKVIIPTTLPLQELSNWDFENFYFQPMDEHDGTIGCSNLEDTIYLCNKYGWRVSCQIQKFLKVK